MNLLASINKHIFPHPGTRTGRNRGRMRFKGGFTMIELLVVLAIIGLLSALIFPALVSARERAMQTSCAGNLRSVGLLMTTYAVDHKERYPSAWRKSESPKYTWEDVLLQSYPGAESTFQGCPKGRYAMNDFAEVVKLRNFGPARNEWNVDNFASPYAVSMMATGDLVSSELLFIADHGTINGWTHPVLRGLSNWKGGNLVTGDFRHPHDTKNVLFFDLHVAAVGIDGFDENLLRVYPGAD